MATHEPLDTPIIGEPVTVATVLGVAIQFNPRTREFEAEVGEEGDAAALHSADFTAIVQRIRQRALVVPVKGYHLTVDIPMSRRSAKDLERLLTVTEVEVTEYHKGRYDPFVITPTDTTKKFGYGARRSRSVNVVHLPTDVHLTAIRAALVAIAEEVTRHEDEAKRLRAILSEALDAVPTLDAKTLRAIQKGAPQVAEPGLAVYDAQEDAQEDAAAS